jgi:hypothetical protein
MQFRVKYIQIISSTNVRACHPDSIWRKWLEILNLLSTIPYCTHETVDSSTVSYTSLHVLSQSVHMVHSPIAQRHNTLFV